MKYVTLIAILGLIVLTGCRNRIELNEENSQIKQDLNKKIDEINTILNELEDLEKDIDQISESDLIGE